MTRDKFKQEKLRHKLIAKLQNLIWRGDLDDAKILHNYTPEFARPIVEHVFQWACRSGQLEGAKWLAVEFPSFSGRVTNLYKAFLHACMFGHLEVVIWLCATYPFLRRMDDIQTNDNIEMYYACYYNSFTLVCWLLSSYTADQFWELNRCFGGVQRVLTNWRNDVEPRRRRFMLYIAPHLPPLI